MKEFKAYANLLLIISLVLLNNSIALAQSQQKVVSHDLSPKITLTDFNNRVDRAINLLRTKKLNAISNEDHINIMMCDNTVGMTHISTNKLLRTLNEGGRKIKIYAEVLRFRERRYEEFEKLMKKVKYQKNIVKVYPNYKWNTGLGYYFPKLKMELGGLPKEYAYFEVSNK
jgi:hypothetical protein